MSEHGFPLAFKWAVTVLADTFVGLISVWWVVRYAYGHDWWNVTQWTAGAALYYWFGVRSHLRWYRGELAADG